MTRCAHTDSEYLWHPDGSFHREKRTRCPHPAQWVWRGAWLCDTHARDRWLRDLAERLFQPRDRSDGRDPDVQIPAWVPASLRDLADRLDPHCKPEQQTLDLDAA